jgi:O-antigen/teichoic acid export membrane protein
MADSPPSRPVTVAPDPGPGEAIGEGTLEDRIRLQGRSLRQHAARGTIVNAAFLVGLSSLALAKGFFVAAYLTRADYGIWGILVVGLGTLGWLKQVGISDKYIQQDDPDQEHAFQRAFTLELLFSAAFVVLVVVLVPLYALIYDESRLIAPGLVAGLVVPAAVLQVPTWVFYRRMDFVRQRALQAIDPVVGFAVTIALAVAGAGYWSLVIGAVAGAWAGAAAAVAASPYRIRLRYDPGTARRYLRFSWPLFAASVGGLLVAQGSVLIGNAVVGLAGVGAIALAATISQYAQRVDGIVTGTLYPAICAVRDRTDLLYESFVKSNRLALMWGLPFGLGLALFAPDLVEFAIGERWRPAVVVIQVFGAIAAIDQIGFNWDAYFRARDETRPIAIASLVAAAAFFAVAVPLMIAEGLTGFAAGMGAVGLATLACRGYFLTRLFDGFDMARHILRALAPSVPAVAAVLAARALDGPHRTVGVALAELGLYLAVTAAATWVFERDLLREAVGYLRGRRPAGAAT